MNTDSDRSEIAVPARPPSLSGVAFVGSSLQAA